VTEHALLDDNGDAAGSRADSFRGLEPNLTVPGGPVIDGRRAHQWHLVPSRADEKLSPELRQKRNHLELAVHQLRDQKSQLARDDYYRRLEKLLVELAELNELPEQ